MEETLSRLFDSVKSIEDRLKTIEEKLDQVDKLKDTMSSLEEEVSYLKSRDNDREQRDRNSSIRVFGLELPEDDMTKPLKIMKKLYSELLEPILQYAVVEGDIEEVPSMLDLLETAHILPQAKTAQKTRGSRPTGTQIIARFKSRPFRALVFQNKKDFFKENNKPKISISEDLTKVNFAKFMEIKEKPEIAAAWSINGNIRYTTKKEDKKVMKLKSAYDNPKLE